MSVYVKIKKSLLTDIADAIRAKFALGGTYTPAQMAEAINNVTLEGSNINDNKFINGGWTEYTNNEVLEISTGAFSGSKNLTSVSFPNVENISGMGTFYGCTALTSVNLPAVTTISGMGTFYNCTALQSISLPELLTINADQVFYQCNKLTTINLPKLTTINGDNTFAYLRNIESISLPELTSIEQAYSFTYCQSLTSVNLPKLTTVPGYSFNACNALSVLDLPSLTSIANYGFYNATALTTLILRSETMCTLGTTNPFYNTNIFRKTGYVYVPSALVNTYKADSAWSTYADQIRAIEDYPDICGTV